ncbi:polyhydroxyalkanoate synthesis repressor PhaR [Altererythrobacter sp.]|uniref:polyhydroxyalkanoate synthesis repressor PhaR n=1 Tax=Altererythrobacter sp. TaxID=1872480 RepID=UPI001B28A26A|nr:polyhydroxyalkanoate synthesis repressor PhaR [Altererythrobacter sp.]MBO6608337.1 polyhydroxyalkanoate synthesis repressor PhaR [Altererythrobacter sp.]MBO6641406.1 polyhydroxyalkanoate synthesis repressor PhaR [Altererythrobacter sp.]MBO6707895.1 polyhydroxyalkanoate synthesis repressor PhaR [Altererythrobacter sp.]MBO6945973.1 polyhydroxyalkanoate synthesis repressor PhaR [Altererythrobacter sp.]
MAKKKSADGDTVIVKKYANRRLYNTSTSSYITLDDLAGMVREDVDFQVLDAKTGEDITHSILTQIIMDEEASGGEQMLPVNFLRQLISMYGNSMQSMMPSYLEAAMTNFRENHGKIREAFEKGISNTPFAKIHETNMAMMRAATDVLMPGSSKSGGKAKENAGSEIDALRKQMAEMQKKLDELSK